MNKLLMIELNDTTEITSSTIELDTAGHTSISCIVPTRNNAWLNHDKIFSSNIYSKRLHVCCR